MHGKQRLKYKISTYADYLSMREGDYIFFFTDRKIYGVGKLTNLVNDCKYWLFDGANIAKPFSDILKFFQIRYILKFS